MSVMMQNVIASGASSLYRNNFKFLLDANNANPGVPSGSNISTNVPDQSGNGYGIDFDTTIWRDGQVNYFEGRASGGGSIGILEGSTGSFASPLLITNPTVFSINCWSRSSGSDAGKICGFQTGTTNMFWTETNYDRHIYVDENGNVRFGCQNGLLKLTVNGGYVNDGLWKNVCATYEAGVMSIYINGILIDSRSDAGVANYTGVWRLFSYALGGWPATSSFQQSFNGDIALASVYNICLGSGQINQNFLSLRSRFGV